VAFCRKGSEEVWRGKGETSRFEIAERIKEKKNGNKISLDSDACVLLWGAPIKINAFFRLYQFEMSLNG